MTSRSSISKRSTPAAFRVVSHTRLQRACSCAASASGPECEDCRQKRLQRVPTASAPNLAPSIVHHVLRSPSRPLDAHTRSFVEPLFGVDFSRVRIHDDQHADSSASAVHALAYTVGQHLVFARGQYNPHTHEGLRLLTHELTHAVQQRHAAPSSGPLPIGDAADSYESEATANAKSIPHHAHPARNFAAQTLFSRQPSASSKPVLQRKVPAGISLAGLKSFGHSELVHEEDKNKFHTYIGAVALMQLTPHGDYTAERDNGDCTKEFITELANSCPASTKPFCTGDRCFEVGKHAGVGDALAGKLFDEGPDTFVDFHRDRQRGNFLAGSNKKQCSVVCHQVYKYRTAADHKYHELGAFYIIRNFQATTYKPAGATSPEDITTGTITKIPAPTSAPAKDDFAKSIAPGLVKSGSLLDAPPSSFSSVVTPKDQPK